MLLGIRGHDLGRHSHTEALPFLKQTGFMCVQLVLHKLIAGFSSYEDEFPNSLLNDLKASSQECGLSIALLGCYLDLTNRALEDANLKLYQKYAGIASRLGCGYVGTESAALAMPLEECLQKRDYLLFIVPKICRTMADNNVTLLLEPVGFQPFNDPALCRRLMQSCPKGSLKFIFDPSNLLRSEQKDEQNTLWQKWFDCKAFTDNTVVMHVKDYVMQDDFNKLMTPLGHGIVDFEILRPYITKLPALSFAVREGQDPNFVKQDLNFMREYFA